MCFSLRRNLVRGCPVSWTDMFAIIKKLPLHRPFLQRCFSAFETYRNRLWGQGKENNPAGAMPRCARQDAIKYPKSCASYEVERPRRMRDGAGGAVLPMTRSVVPSAISPETYSWTWASRNHSA